MMKLLQFHNDGAITKASIATLLALLDPSFQGEKLDGLCRDMGGSLDGKVCIGEFCAWLFGDARLLCQDCIEARNNLALLSALPPAEEGNVTQGRARESSYGVSASDHLAHEHGSALSLP